MGEHQTIPEDLQKDKNKCYSPGQFVVRIKTLRFPYPYTLSFVKSLYLNIPEA